MLFIRLGLLQSQRHDDTASGHRSDTLVLFYKESAARELVLRFPPAKQIAQIIYRVFILFLCALSFSAGDHLYPTDWHFINFPLFINTQSVSEGVCTRRCISEDSFLLLQP